MTDFNKNYHTGFQFGIYLHSQDSDMDFKEMDLSVREFLEKMGGSIDLSSAENSEQFYDGVVNGYILGAELEDE